jgi:hypothetical protein
MILKALGRLQMGKFAALPLYQKTSSQWPGFLVILLDEIAFSGLVST